MFPCPQCGPAAAQVKSLFDYWVANGVNVTRVWLDVEGTSYWLGNADSNRVHPPMLPPPPAAPPPCPHLTPLLQAWYAQLFDACASMQLNFGVYGATCLPHARACAQPYLCAASLSQWSEIFGSSSFTHGAPVPLWYAHYDVRLLPLPLPPHLARISISPCTHAPLTATLQGTPSFDDFSAPPSPSHSMPPLPPLPRHAHTTTARLTLCSALRRLVYSVYEAILGCRYGSSPNPPSLL